MVRFSPEQAADAVELRRCPKCEAPAGSPCRTRSGTVAASYHTARFVLVPALREALAVAIPAGRPDRPGPGMPWTPGPPVHGPAPPTGPSPIRIGYARCSTAEADIRIQLDALDRADCKLIFSETISHRSTIRPEFHNALTLAHDLKHAAPDQPVILTVYELNRPARTTNELIAMAAALTAGGIQLELLTGPLAGIHDPKGEGAILFTVLAAAAQLDRDYNRDRALEGHQAAVLRRATMADDRK